MKSSRYLKYPILFLPVLVLLSCGQQEFLHPKQINHLWVKAHEDFQDNFSQPENHPTVEDVESLFEGLEPSTLESLKLSDPPASGVDLRSFDTPIKSQGKRGWCTSFSVVAGIELFVSLNQNKSIDLSEKHHWYGYKYYNTRRSIRSATKKPLVPEWAWPYYGKKHQRIKDFPTISIDQYEYIKGREAIDEALRNDNPVVMGVITNSSWHNKSSQGVINYKGKKRGGHSVGVVGIQYSNDAPGGGYLIIKNSWGSSWGDHGYGYIPFQYCSRFKCYFATIQSVIDHTAYQALPPSAPPQEETITAPREFL